jgi:hypothetical protein
MTFRHLGMITIAALACSTAPAVASNAGHMAGQLLKLPHKAHPSVKIARPIAQPSGRTGNDGLRLRWAQPAAIGGPTHRADAIMTVAGTGMHRKW